MGADSLKPASGQRGELKSEPDSSATCRPGPANQIHPPHAGRVRRRPSPAAPVAFPTTRATAAAHAHARAPVKKSGSARGLGRWEWEGGMDRNRIGSTRRQPAWLSTLSCPVGGFPAKSKRNTGRNCLVRSCLFLSSLLPVEARRRVVQSTSRLQLQIPARAVQL